MKQKWKKMSSLFLGVYMILTMWPTIAYAADITINETTFPDANFRAWIIENSMNKNEILTETEIASFTSMLLPNEGISSLEGMEYFIYLQGLDCSGNNLSELPELPTTLNSLNCSNNNLTELPDLPSGLLMLVCNNNELSALPELPSSLNALYCSNNRLTVLPELPSSLKLLICNDNSLTALELNDSADFNHINVSNNLMKDENDVTGNNITWDGTNFIFSPQKDTTPPVLSNGSSFRMDEVSGSITFTTDEAGTVYYKMVNSGAAAPAKADIVSGGTAFGVGVAAAVTRPLTLTADAKDIYVVVRDEANNISDPLKIELAAAPDLTSPTLSNGVADRASDTEATIYFRTDEAGTAFYTVVDKDASTPDKIEVAAGTSLGAVVSGGFTEKEVTLSAGEKDIYVVVKDAANNISIPLKIEVGAYVTPVQTVANELTALGFSAAVNDNTVTVTGTVTGVTVGKRISIPSGVTVKWSAVMTGTVYSVPMLSVANEGSLEIVSGAKLENFGSVGETLDSYKNGNLLVSGGEISFSGNMGYAISVRDGGSCVITGGTVSPVDDYSYQLWLDGALAVIANNALISTIYTDNQEGASAVVRVADGTSSVLTGSAEGLTVTPYNLETGDSLTTQWLVRSGVSGINVLKNKSSEYWFAPYSGVTIHSPIPGIAPTITTDSLLNGTVDSAYSQTLAATGDTPITWSIDSGSLPDGLTLNGSTGGISGTPTGSGTFSFTVKAANSTDSVTKVLSIVIDPAPMVNRATISPTGINYDLNAPNDIVTNITWNSASTVTDVVYGTTSLTTPDVYVVSGSALTIKSSYINTLGISKGDVVTFTISFDKGASATLTVNTVDGYIPATNANLNELTVNGSPVSGFDPNTTVYNVELLYGTASVLVGAIPEDAHATVAITQPQALLGDATVVVTAEDKTTAKSYTIHFTLEAAPAGNYSITLQSGGNGTVTANVYAASKGTEITLAATPNSGYSFAGWTSSDGVSFANAGSAATTFTMPGKNVTVTANWSYNGSSGGSTGGGNSGGGSTGGDSGSTTGDGSASAEVKQKTKPDQPTIGSATVKAKKGTDSSAKAEISDNTVTNAIAKAQTEAKEQGKNKNGIGVSLSVSSPAGTKSLGIVLTQPTLTQLTKAEVASFEIDGSLGSLNFDLEAIKEIQKQSSGAVTINITPVTGLNGDAKTLVGTRPVYNISISYVKDGKTVNITTLGSGSVTLSLPYTPGKNEAVGYLFGVYVDGKGNATRIEGSTYDANSKSIIFNSDHFSVYGVGYMSPSEKFKDISSNWAKESIDYVVGRGLFSGTSATAFSPDAAMSRGMLVTALGRLAGVDVGDYKTVSFTDVAADKYYAPYIEWAYKNGIVSGIGNSQFAPDRAITREEIALILSNYAKATGYTLPVTREAAAFADDLGIGSTYKEAVTTMQQSGIMMGGNGNRFNPGVSATRAEVSAMLHRYIKLTIDPATAQGWAVNDAGQRLYYKDGKALTGWQTIASKKYFFDTDGAMQTGWKKDDKSNWYYLSINGALVGWQNIGSGESKKRYYFTKDAVMVSAKWLEIDKKWYYFNTDGSLAISTKVDGYEVDKNGVRKTK